MPFVHGAADRDAAVLNGTTPSVKHDTYGKYPLFDRSQRPLHVVVAGAGPSGLALAVELKKLPYVTFEVFEKNPNVGGTWLENRYPGAACDVASHAYQYTFESKTDWSKQYASLCSLFIDHYYELTRKVSLQRKRLATTLSRSPKSMIFTGTLNLTPKSTERYGTRISRNGAFTCPMQRRKLRRQSWRICS